MPTWEEVVRLYSAETRARMEVGFSAMDPATADYVATRHMLWIHIDKNYPFTLPGSYKIPLLACKERFTMIFTARATSCGALWRLCFGQVTCAHSWTFPVTCGKLRAALYKYVVPSRTQCAQRTLNAFFPGHTLREVRRGNKAMVPGTCA